MSGPEAEKAMVSGAIRTDLILSAEIMVIALNEVADEPFLSRLIDPGRRRDRDHDRRLRRGRDHREARRRRPLPDRARVGVGRQIGHGLLVATPKLLATLSVVGVVAMLWVGGHIVLVGLDELGWHAPYDFVHHLEHEVHHAIGGTLGSVAGWLTNTLASAVFGLVVGGVLVGVMHLIPRRSKAAARH